jgi:hypothetical protein
MPPHPKPKHKHQHKFDHSEMRKMGGWIVRITYSKCTWPRCKNIKRDVKRLEKL